jgi:hypothetical protein
MARQTWHRMRRYFLMLVSIDVTLVALNVLLKAMAFLQVVEAVPKPFRIDSSQSLGSYYNYLKWLLLAVLLGVMWRRARCGLFGVLAALFLFFLIDDAFEVHEAVGLCLANALDLSAPLGLRGQDLGEMLFWLAFLAVLGPVLVMAFRQAPARARAAAGVCLLLVLLLAFFGIFVDAVHMMAFGIPGQIGVAVTFGFEMLEEGGEMIVGSALLAFAISLIRPGSDESAPPGPG